jgi:signal-transduction protein with cAMP-binding, CBS, and nucleotidyltransferase domain
MPDRVRDVMTANPVVLPQTASVLDAARAMAEANVGPVLVVDRQEALCGVVTDRDIVVRAVATGRRLESTALVDMCTEAPATVSSSDLVGDAIRLMRRHAVRRLPVVEAGRPVGMVSLGDLVLEADSVGLSEVGAALADITAAPPDDPSTEAHPNVTAALRREWDVPRMAPAEALEADGLRRTPKAPGPGPDR